MASLRPQTNGLDLETRHCLLQKKAITLTSGLISEDRMWLHSQTKARHAMLGLSYYLNGYPGRTIPLLEKYKTWSARQRRRLLHLGIAPPDKNYRRSQSLSQMLDVPEDSAASCSIHFPHAVRQESINIAEE